MATDHFHLKYFFGIILEMKNNQSPTKKRSNLIHTKLRLTAGEYLTEQIYKLKFEVFGFLMYAIINLFYSFLIIWWYNFPPSLSTVISTVSFSIGLALVSIIFCFPRFRRWQNCQFGRDGELLVSQILHQEKERDWNIFDDVQMGGYNVDHIILCRSRCPGGHLLHIGCNKNGAGGFLQTYACRRR